MASYELPPQKSIWDFDPRSIGGCALWYDAADDSSVTGSGTSGFSWRNKGGSATTSLLGTSYPSLTSNAVNGLSAVNVPDFNYRIDLNGNHSTTYTHSSTGQISFFAVVNPGSSTSLSEIADLNGSTRFSVYWTPSVPQISFSITGNSSSNITSGVSGITSTFMLSITSAGFSSTGTLLLNGTSVGTIVTGAGSYSYLEPVLSRDSGAGSQNYCEVIAFSTLLSTTQQQQIEGYLAWKWGLKTLLPVTHPYYSSAGAIVRPFARQFIPTDVATPCRVWYDATDSVYQSSVGTSATFATGVGSGPRGGRFDSLGNLWVVVGNTVNTLTKVTSAAVVSTVTITGTGIPITASYIALDGSNNMYVATGSSVVKILSGATTSTAYATPSGTLKGLAWDSTNSVLWWGLSTGSIVTFNGTTQTTYSGLIGAGGILVGAVYGGSLYTHNGDLNKIVKYTITAGSPPTLSSPIIVSTTGYTLFSSPSDLTVDGNGIVYVSNTLTTISSIIRVGSDGSAYAYSNANYVYGVACDSSNILYGVGFSANTVVKYTTSGTGVGRWSDKSGNGNDIGVYSGTRPTYDSTTNMLVPAGSTSYLLTPTLTMASATARCTFVVVKVPTFPADTTQQYLQPILTNTTLSQALGGYFVRYERASGTGQNYYIEQGVGSGPYFFYGPSGQQAPYTGAYMVVGVQRSGQDFTYSLNGNVSTSLNYSVSVSLSTATISGTTATLTFTASQGVIPCYTGQTITVAGVSVASGNNYNGTWTVLASPAPSATQVSYTIAASTPTVSGTGGTVACPLNGNPLSDTYRIGQTSSGLNTHSIGEVIMYDGALTDVDRFRVESYLMWKWNNVRTSYSTAAGNTIPNYPSTHSFYTFPAPTVTLNPRSFGSLYMWYDGADASTITGSAPMTQWNDKSGNGNNLTTSAGPTRSATSNNPVGFDITFNGASFMSITSFAVAINTTSFSYFSVFINNTASGNNARMVSAGTTLDSGADSSGFFVSSQGADTVAPFRMTPNKGNSGNSYYVTKSTYHIISLIFTSTPNFTLFVDGVSQGTLTTGSATFNFTQLSVGRSLAGSLPFSGVINENVMFTTSLSTFQRQQMEGYLAWKWGLQNNLPPTHAYSKIRP